MSTGGVKGSKGPSFFSGLSLKKGKKDKVKADKTFSGKPVEKSTSGGGIKASLKKIAGLNRNNNARKCEQLKSMPEVTAKPVKMLGEKVIVSPRVVQNLSEGLACGSDYRESTKENHEKLNGLIIRQNRAAKELEDAVSNNSEEADQIDARMQVIGKDEARIDSSCYEAKMKRELQAVYDKWKGVYSTKGDELKAKVDEKKQALSSVEQELKLAVVAFENGLQEDMDLEIGEVGYNKDSALQHLDGEMTQIDEACRKRMEEIKKEHDWLDDDLGEISLNAMTVETSIADTNKQIEAETQNLQSIETALAKAKIGDMEVQQFTNVVEKMSVADCEKTIKSLRKNNERIQKLYEAAKKKSTSQKERLLMMHKELDDQRRGCEENIGIYRERLSKLEVFEREIGQYTTEKTAQVSRAKQDVEKQVTTAQKEIQSKYNKLKTRVLSQPLRDMVAQIPDSVPQAPATYSRQNSGASTSSDGSADSGFENDGALKRVSSASDVRLSGFGDDEDDDSKEYFV